MAEDKPITTQPKAVITQASEQSKKKLIEFKVRTKEEIEQARNKAYTLLVP